MTAVFIILIGASLGLALAGALLLMPRKGRRGQGPSAQMVSSDSMVRVSPAGPGRLRMSFSQGDRMPVEVMLQIAEIKEDTDLDRLRDPQRTPQEKQEVVNRLRSLGYEIAYDPFPEAAVTDPADSGFTYMKISEPETSDLPDHGEGEVDPVTLRSFPEEPDPPSDGYSEFLEDTAAMAATEDTGGAAPPGTPEAPEDGSPTAEDERLREVADAEGLGGIQLLDPGLRAEEGQDGKKAIALMEYLSTALREGLIESRIVQYAEELLSIQVKDAPWRDGREPRLRPESEYRPLDESVMAMDLDEFDIYVRSQAPDGAGQGRKEAGRSPRRVPAWDRLDMD